MANFPRPIAMLLLFASLAIGAGCSTSRVYQAEANTASSPNLININTASADELERLPGVGRGTAEAIVSYRAANGPFRRAEHLLLIRGISERRFSGFRGYIKAE